MPKTMVQTAIPTIFIDRIPKRGERIGFQQLPNQLWKVLSIKEGTGKTVLRNMKTKQRLVVRLRKQTPKDKFPGVKHGPGSQVKRVS